jgi:hypothetical protein
VKNFPPWLLTSTKVEELCHGPNGSKKGLL